MADRAATAAAEIATLRQRLAAAEARIRKIEDKDNALKPLRERMAGDGTNLYDEDGVLLRQFMRAMRWSWQSTAWQ
jgi:hypothetical protein